MFNFPPAIPLHAVDSPAPEPTLFTDLRLNECALQLALANATLIRLEQHANRTTLSLRHELTPRLERLRLIETQCLEWLGTPQALESPTVPRAVTLLQDEVDALETLSEHLSPQALTLHLQQREALADRCRTAMRLLPRHERTCARAQAYFDALVRLDTTDDVRQLPDALAGLQTAVDGLVTFVARRREAQRGQTVARASLRPSEQCPGMARGVQDRRRRLPDTASSTPLSSAMPPLQTASKRPRTGAPGSIPDSATREILRFAPYR